MMTDRSRGRQRVVRGSSLPRWIFVALGIAVALHAGLEFARAPGERTAEIQRWERDLGALADDRRLSVIAWLHSASADAQSIAGARRTEAFIRAGAAASGETGLGAVEDMLDRFAQPRGDSLAGIWIVGVDRSVIAAESHAPAPDSACLAAAASADTAGRPGTIHLHAGVPIVPVAAAIVAFGPSNTASPGASATSGAALFAFAARPLFALLGRRPSQPNSLESYLVRSRAGHLDFLSPLLFGKPAAGAFDDPRLGARAAAEGRDTFSEGLDYRDSVDNRVLTVTRAIPGTDWGLVVEVDVSEALGPLGERQRTRRLLAIGVWIGLFGVAFGAARTQRAALATEASRVAARYIALVDAANDALVVLDVDGRVVEANRRASELYGRTRDEILRMNADDFRQTGEGGETDDRLAGVLKAGGGVFHTTHVRADGTTFPAEVSARLVTEPGGEQRIVVVTRDGTARRADADRIRRLNRLLRTLSSVNKVIVRDPDEQHLFDDVCRISVEEAGFVGAWVGLANRTTGGVDVAARAGAAQDFGDTKIRWDHGPFAQGAAGTAIREERTVVATMADARMSAWREEGERRGFRSIASTPVRRSGAVTGALTLYSGEPAAFDAEFVGLIEDMAAEISFALTTIDNRRARVEADDKARETETRFRTVLESLPLVVAAFDAEGKIVFWNRGAAEITGFAQEVVGKSPPFDALYPDPERRVHAVQIWTESGDGLVERETTIRARDGSERVIVWSGLTRLVNVPGWTSWGIAIDVTKIRRAEEEARRVLLAIEQVTDAVLITDPVGTVVYANPAACHILGFEQDDIVGQNPRLWKEGADAIAADAEMSRTIAAGSAWQGTLVQRTKAGGPFQLSATVGPIRGADGTIQGYVGVSRDVTSERALLVAKEAAEHASRAKSSFLAHISHEIRTPMNAILGYAQLLLRDDALSAAQRQKVGVIHSSGAHLLQVLNDVLEMSKIEAGRIALTAAPFDLQALLGEVESMFNVLTATKGVALELECSPELPRALDADGGKVKQVVINLLSNAVKFTDAGTISIHASSTAVAADKHDVRIAVEDTGIGIDPEGLGRLFQTFEQLAAGARIGGTGLGLAISRNFAQLMGGDLTVRSTPRAGSLFTFTFEARVAEVALAQRGDHRVPVRIEAGQLRPKVLVVDDVATNRALCDELLSRVGYEIRRAGSGEEALAIHETWRPDVILMDLRMPGMDGFEAISRLRASGSKARIVALTASGLSDAEPAALAVGADMFLRKPVEEGDLLRRIGELLGLRYEYPAGAKTPSSAARDQQPLSEVVAGLPPDLVHELREAAVGARARRIEDLAARVSEHSEAAAGAIRDLVRRFRYDLILAALGPEAHVG